MPASDTEIQVQLTADMAQLQAGMDAGAASVAKGAEAMQASVAEASATMKASQADMTASIAAEAAAFNATVQARIDAMVRLNTAFAGNISVSSGVAEAESALDAAMAAGALTAAQYQGFIDRLNAAELGMAASTDAATVATEANTAATTVNARTQYELGIMLSELASGNVGRLKRSGAALSNATGLTARLMSTTGLAVLGAAAAVAAFGYEVVKGIDESNQFNKALEQTGGFIGVTEGQFDGMAAAIQGSETTIGTAREAMMGLAQTGKFSGDAMQTAGKAVVDFAALTGKSIDQAIADVVRIQDEPVKALEKLNEQYHFLTLAQDEHIRKLADEGDATAAAREAVELFQESQTSRLAKANQDVGLLVQSWRGLKSAISAAADAVQDFGKKQSDQSKFDVLYAQLERLNAAKERGVVLDLRGDGKSVLIDDEISDIRKKMGAMQDARVEQEKLNAATVANQKVQDAGIAAQPEIDALKKLVKGEDAYTEALNRAKAALKAQHDANPNAESAKNVTFDDKGEAIGGAGLEAIEAALHKKYDVKVAGAKKERESLSEELRREEADQQVSNADKLTFELAFWTRKLDAAKQGSKTYADAYAQINALTRQIDTEKQRAALQAAKEAQEAAKEEVTSAITSAQSALNIQKEKIQTQFALGQSSAQMEIAQLAAANDAEYSLELDALKKYQATLDQKTKAYAESIKQIEKLEANHKLEMLKSNDDAQKANLAAWQKYMAPINNAFNQSINGMIQGTQTFKRGLDNILSSILASYVQLGIQTAIHWATTELAKTTATTAGAAERAIVEAGAATASKATDAATGKSQITSAAATGAAKAYQAIVGIPFVGPVLAPVAAGVAFAGIEAFSGMISSAERGWDRVPIDGAITQLHKNEMVLPAPLAEGVRRMSAQGGQGGGMVVNLSSTDPRGFKDYLRRNPGALADAMRYAGRMGHLAGTHR